MCGRIVPAVRDDGGVGHISGLGPPRNRFLYVGWKRNMTSRLQTHGPVCSSSGKSFSEVVVDLWDEAGSNFVAIRHDLRQPITGVRLALALLRRNFAELSLEMTPEQFSAAQQGGFEDVKKCEDLTDELSMRLARPERTAPASP